MPGRVGLLADNEIYHVFNRGIDHRPTFSGIKEYSRAFIALKFYHFQNPPLRLSFLLKKSKEEREKILQSLKKKKNVLADILCYCFMPNHFHLLLRQKTKDGISKFLSIFQNSYTRYFNTKNKRKGPLFLDQFKAVRIQTDEQLLHVSRYIHLNPYTSFVVKKIEDIKDYPFSSLLEYLEEVSEEYKICETKTIGGFFKDSKRHYQFIADQADYQRELDMIKHLMIED
jgi:putative transposase